LVTKWVKILPVPDDDNGLFNLQQWINFYGGYDNRPEAVTSGGG
jgi:hypothetical protein